MYLPASFKCDERERILKLMEENPFATVIDGAGGIHHIPVLTEVRGEQAFLLGHFARDNPAWRSLDGTTVIFHGPHTYITPTWYPDQLNVPTWNYAVVHARGKSVVLEDHESIERILEKTVERFERNEPRPWSYSIPDEFRKRLTRAIVGFEIEVTEWDAKFKLSQNRAPEDRAGVIAGLKTRADDLSRGVLEWMTIK